MTAIDHALLACAGWQKKTALCCAAVMMLSSKLTPCTAAAPQCVQLGHNPGLDPTVFWRLAEVTTATAATAVCASAAPPRLFRLLPGVVSVLCHAPYAGEHCGCVGQPAMPSSPAKTANLTLE